MSPSCTWLWHLPRRFFLLPWRNLDDQNPDHHRSNCYQFPQQLFHIRHYRSSYLQKPPKRKYSHLNSLKNPELFVGTDLFGGYLNLRMHGLENLSVKRKPECCRHLSSNVSSMQEYVFRLKTDIGLDLFHPHDNLEGNFQTNTIIYTINKKSVRSDGFLIQSNICFSRDADKNSDRSHTALPLSRSKGFSERCRHRRRMADRKR